MHLRLGAVLSSLFVLAAAFPPGPAFASPPRLLVAGHDDHGGEGSDAVIAASPLGPTACEAGFADIYPCRGIDLMSFLPVDQLGDPGERPSGIWGWTDPQTRREYVLFPMARRTVFVDVTDPGSPRVVGDLPGHDNVSTSNREVNVYADHAFVVADFAGDHGIQIFDLTQLRNVSGSRVRFSPTARYTEVGPVHNLFINQETGFAYALGSDLCESGIHMIDVRNPRDPRPVGCFFDGSSGKTYVHDTQCVIYRGPDRRFSGREICFASNPEALQIVDVTDKSAPRLLGQAGYPESGFIHQGWLTEDQRYFLMDDELDEERRKIHTTTHLWDVSDLTRPRRFATHVASTGATDHNQYVIGGYVYQANYTAGLRILDLARIAQGRLTEVAFFDTAPESDAPGYGGAWGLYPFFPSGSIAISSTNRGLFLVRRSSGGSAPGPVPDVCRPGPGRLCLLGNRYAVDVIWSNQFDGSSGVGRARQASDLAGYFSFGDPANLELMVKMLELDGEVRFFYGQLTDLQVTIRVADTKTGQVREYSNGPNNCGAIITLPSAAELSGAARHGEHDTGSCKPGKDRLCLGHRRFQVEVEWRNQFDGTAGAGRGAALSDLTGSFAFQDPRNVELLVKVLDFDDRILVAWGALSNLEYTLKVTDTESGAVKTYHNPAGTYCGGLDQEAF